MWKRVCITVLVIVSAMTALYSVSDGEYSIKAGFAFDSVTSEHLVIYEPTLSYEKSRFYNSGDIGTMFNLSINMPLTYSVDGYFASPFRLFVSFDSSFNLAVRHKALRYYIGPAFSFDALLTQNNGMRVQLALSLYQNIGFEVDVSRTIGFAGGIELYSNIYTGDFMDSDLSGFFNGWKFKARPYIALTVNYADDFSFGS